MLFIECVWLFWTVVLEKTLESPWDFKEIKPVHPKGNQSWTFIGRTDAEAEAPNLWPPDVKSQLIGKDPDAGKDWRQEEKGVTEDEMVGWHHWFNGHGFELKLGDSGGQGSLVCYSLWSCKESDTTEWLENNNNVILGVALGFQERKPEAPKQWVPWAGAEKAAPLESDCHSLTLWTALRQSASRIQTFAVQLLSGHFLGTKTLSGKLIQNLWIFDQVNPVLPVFLSSTSPSWCSRREETLNLRTKKSRDRLPLGLEFACGMKERQCFPPTHSNLCEPFLSSTWFCYNEYFHHLHLCLTQDPKCKKQTKK